MHQMKYLGLLIDFRLSWLPAVRALQRCSSACGKELVLDQRQATRVCLGLPHRSLVAATYTEAATWSIELRAFQAGMRHKSSDRAALPQQFHGHPNSQGGMLLHIYKEDIVVPQRPPRRPTPDPGPNGPGHTPGPPSSEWPGPACSTWAPQQGHQEPAASEASEQLRGGGPAAPPRMMRLPRLRPLPRTRNAGAPAPVLPPAYTILSRTCSS